MHGAPPCPGLPCGTWKMLAPYGVLQALSRLSFPVLRNQRPAKGGQGVLGGRNGDNPEGLASPFRAPLLSQGAQWAPGGSIWPSRRGSPQERVARENLGCPVTFESQKNHKSLLVQTPHEYVMIYYLFFIYVCIPCNTWDKLTLTNDLLRFRSRWAACVLWCGLWCAVLGTPPGTPEPCPVRGRTAGGEFEGEHTALVKVQLVLLRLADVQNFHVAALHAHRQPVLVRAVAQGEDLGVQTEDGRSEPPSDGGGRPAGEEGGPVLSHHSPAWRGSWPRAWNTAGNRMSNH